MDALQVLIIEDSDQDAALIERELAALCAGVRVGLIKSEAQLCAALEDVRPDLVLVDFVLPGFGGLEALAIVRRRLPDVPVVVVSGSIGEECAAELLRAGANDFVLKSNLARLGPVVERELAAARMRQQTQEAERQRRETDERYSRVVETAEEGVWEMDGELRTTFVNRSLAEMLGYSPEAMLGRTVDSFMHPDELADHAAKISQRRQGRAGRYERRFVRADGSDLWALVAAAPILGSNGEFRGGLAMVTDITARKLAQDALRESEEKYRVLVEAASEGICIAQDGRLQFVNSRMCEMSGYDRDELLGMSFAERIHPEDRGMVIAHHRARLAGEEVPETYDFRFITGSGETRWVQNCGVVLAWEGRPATLNFLVDVTRRKLAERELSIRSAALEAAANPILILDSQGIVQWANPAFTTLTGQSLDNVVGNPLREVQPGQTGHGSEVDIWRAMALGQVWRGEAPAARRDGTQYVEKTTLTPVYDEGGAITHYIAIKEDVTEHRRAEKRQRSQLEFMQALMNTIPNPVFYKDAAGRYRGCNPAFADFVGRRPEDVLGKTVFDLWRAELAAVYAARDQELLGRGGTQTYEGQVERGDGKIRQVIFSKACLRDADGSHSGLVGVIVDVTEQREIQQQWFQAQKMEAIGRLAGGVAHDYNNALQAILSLAQVLRLTEKDAKRKCRLLDLEEHVRRGAQLTRQFLLFSRRETSRPERLDLGEVVEAATSLLRRIVREDVQLSVERAGGPVPVLADRGQIEQVVVNLAMNGAEAMPGGGRMVVKTDVFPPNWASLEVEDTGSGIAPDVRPHIFEPFYSTKGRGRGSGLGLAVVEGIVRGLGGRIEVDTEVGRGTRFRILLQLAPDSSTEDLGNAPHGEDTLPQGGGEKVLVIEDEQGAREGLTEALTMLGYEVFAAGSGEEALSLPVAPSMDAVISDLVLPGIPGPDVVHELTGRWPRLAAILMSGYTDDESVQKQARDRSLRFLNKPFEIAQMAVELRAALVASKTRGQVEPESGATRSKTSPESVSEGGEDGE